MCKIIAIGHRPPGGELRIVHMAGHELMEDLMPKTQDPIMQFCEKIITGVGGLHDFQYYEMAVEKEPHDVCVAAWVVRCLANPACENSQMVLDLILDRRKKVLADQRAAELSSFYSRSQP